MEEALVKVVAISSGKLFDPMLCIHLAYVL